VRTQGRVEAEILEPRQVSGFVGDLRRIAALEGVDLVTASAVLRRKDQTAQVAANNIRTPLHFACRHHRAPLRPDELTLTSWSN
jgi:hypothetical protein